MEFKWGTNADGVRCHLWVLLYFMHRLVRHRGSLLFMGVDGRPGHRLAASIFSRENKSGGYYLTFIRTIFAICGRRANSPTRAAVLIFPLVSDRFVAISCAQF